MQSENLLAAISELKTATSVSEWNTIREKHFASLTQSELAYVDGSGLITEVLGGGK